MLSILNIVTVHAQSANKMTRVLFPGRHQAAARTFDFFGRTIQIPKYLFNIITYIYIYMHDHLYYDDNMSYHSHPLTTTQYGALLYGFIT